jgi:hypothetical protein
MATQVYEQDRPNGPVAAALLAGGIGIAAIGVTTTLAESSTAVATAFTWSGPVGPLSGKIGVGLIIYFVAWLVLHFSLRGKNVRFATYATLSFVLLIVGLLLTFPPVFYLIAGK